MCFIYVAPYHVIVIVVVKVLYKLAYTASCQRDTVAEDWHKK